MSVDSLYKVGMERNSPLESPKRNADLLTGFICFSIQ